MGKTTDQEKKFIGGRISINVAHDVRVFCAIHNIKQQALLEIALKEYMETFI